MRWVTDRKLKTLQHVASRLPFRSSTSKSQDAIIRTLAQSRVDEDIAMDSLWSCDAEIAQEDCLFACWDCWLSSRYRMPVGCETCGLRASLLEDYSEILPRHPRLFQPRTRTPTPTPTPNWTGPACTAAFQIPLSTLRLIFGLRLQLKIYLAHATGSVMVCVP